MKLAVCESCGPLPLSPLWTPGTTKFNHEHGTGHRVRLKESAVTEHHIMPVPDPPKCDFCSSSTAQWDYPARSFSHRPPEPLRRHLPTFNSLGDWAACQRCHELIEAGDRRGLADRSARTHPQRRSIPMKTLRQVCRALHDDFWAHREGGPTPISTT